MWILTIQNYTLTDWVSLFRKITAVLTLVMHIEVSCLHQTVCACGRNPDGLK